MGLILSTLLNLLALAGSGQAGPWSEFLTAEPEVAVYGDLVERS
jgi:hypothetical protein